ncbi:B12-binding domain-containing radical SAM protein [Streptomyces sp. 8L]|uniref:B12-binding domain-containing radical SAM protein n=1 Tax=Streptomyces sp. 8L TaxID=2877242 RepID=UPI001CD20BA1|nr:radical SAM protein [Streptomyces sp. 8L]MCA1217114.1 radical SAM protein [Streptomyces sp. 8L]
MAPTDAEVWLVFPPLVETNFGSFFPATAVLAAYLEQQGVSTLQDDLNEDFAVWLLNSQAYGGADRGPAPESSAAAAGRWLAKSRDRMFGPDGRHRFGVGSPYGHVLQLMAQQYLIDPGEDVLERGDLALRAALPYQDFYDQVGLAERVPRGAVLFGVSVPMGPQLLPALLLAERLKHLHPETPVVLGGPALSLMHLGELERLLVAWPAVDAVVRFDGEFPLEELVLQARRGNWNPASVKGVSCRTSDGVRHNEPGAGPAINSLPAPLYPPEALAKLDDPVIGITQARGCYWGKCDYCDFIELYDGSPPFRGRRPDRFVEELGHLSRSHGVSRFSFITESIPPAFARRVCAALVEKRLDLRWTSFAMVDRRFDQELLALMVESGCEFLVVGLETTVTRVLKLVHKSADREENLRFLRDARDVGLPLVINLIPDLPTTTYEEALSALVDLEEFADGMRSVSVFPFEPTRSSQVGRAPETFGLDVSAPSSTTGQAQYALNHLVSTDPAMTPTQRAEVHARYRAFADHVHALNNSTFTPDPGRAYAPDEALRVPVEDLDLFEAEAGLVCTNMRTRGRAVVPGRAARLLRPYLDGSPFTPRTLTEALTEDVGSRLLVNLDRAAMLTAASNTRRGTRG